MRLVAAALALLALSIVISAVIISRSHGQTAVTVCEAPAAQSYTSPYARDYSASNC